MKRLLWVLIVILIVASITFIVSCKKVEKNAVRIGAVLPLTGSQAYFGVLNAQAIQMAVDDLKAKGNNIEYYPEDNQSDATKGVTAAKLLVQQKKVNALVIVSSKLAYSITPLLTQEKNTVQLVQASSPIPVKSDNNAIHTFFNAEDNARDVATYVQKKNLKKLVLFTPDDEYGKLLSATFKANAKNVQIKEEAITFGQVDFKSQLAKLKLKDYDAFILLSYGSASDATLLKQLRERNTTIKVIGNYALGTSPIRSLDSSVTNGIEFITSPFDAGIYNQQAKELVTAYKAKFKEDMTLAQAFAYDMVNNYWTYYNNKKADETPKQAYARLFPDNEGTIGKFSYTPEGLIHATSVLVVYSNGAIKELK